MLSSLRWLLYVSALALGLWLGTVADAEVCWLNEATGELAPMSPYLEQTIEPRFQDEFIYVAAAARPYFDLFLAEARMRIPGYSVHQISIKFTDTFQGGGPNTIGLCSYMYGDVPSVTLKRWWYDASSPLEKEELVFHELGHCLLMEGHRKFLLPDGSPGSLMNPDILYPDDYAHHRQYYIQELFSNEHHKRRFMGRDELFDKTGYRW